MPTLEGQVELTIPPDSTSGRKLRLRGKGLGSPSNRGDLYVKVLIALPKFDTLTEKEKELWNALREEENK